MRPAPEITTYPHQVEPIEIKLPSTTYSPKVTIPWLGLDESDASYELYEQATHESGKPLQD